MLPPASINQNVTTIRIRQRVAKGSNGYSCCWASSRSASVRLIPLISALCVDAQQTGGSLAVVEQRRTSGGRQTITYILLALSCLTIVNKRGYTSAGPPL